MVVLIAWIAFILLEPKINLNLIEKYVKIKIFVYIIYVNLEFLIKKNRLMCQ